MAYPLSFAVKCETLGPVELTTDKWNTERDGRNVVIHYSAFCKCGKEHFGFTLPASEIKVHHAVAD